MGIILGSPSSGKLPCKDLHVRGVWGTTCCKYQRTEKGIPLPNHALMQASSVVVPTLRRSEAANNNRRHQRHFYGLFAAWLSLGVWVTNVPDISGTCGPKLVTAAEAFAAAAAGQQKKSSQDEWA